MNRRGWLTGLASLPILSLFFNNTKAKVDWDEIKPPEKAQFEPYRGSVSLTDKNGLGLLVSSGNDKELSLYSHEEGRLVRIAHIKDGVHQPEEILPV